MRPGHEARGQEARGQGPGGQEARRPGGQEARRPGGQEARRPGGQGVKRAGVHVMKGLYSQHFIFVITYEWGQYVLVFVSGPFQPSVM